MNVNGEREREGVRESERGRERERVELISDVREEKRLRSRAYVGKKLFVVVGF